MYFTIFKSGGQYYWNLKAANHEIVAHGEGYARKASALSAINLVKGTTAITPVTDLTGE